MQTKEEITFEHCKKRLASNKDYTRFNVIQYLCRFPEIDPYEMALTEDGVKVFYNDSSISREENAIYKRKVERLVRKRIPARIAAMIPDGRSVEFSIIEITGPELKPVFSLVEGVTSKIDDMSRVDALYDLLDMVPDLEKVHVAHWSYIVGYGTKLDDCQLILQLIRQYGARRYARREATLFQFGQFDVDCTQFG